MSVNSAKRDPMLEMDARIRRAAGYAPEPEAEAETVSEVNPGAQSPAPAQPMEDLIRQMAGRPLADPKAEVEEESIF